MDPEIRVDLDYTDYIGPVTSITGVNSVIRIDSRETQFLTDYNETISVPTNIDVLRIIGKKRFDDAEEFINECLLPSINDITRQMMGVEDKFTFKCTDDCTIRTSNGGHLVDMVHIPSVDVQTTLNELVISTILGRSWSPGVTKGTDEEITSSKQESDSVIRLVPNDDSVVDNKSLIIERHDTEPSINICSYNGDIDIIISAKMIQFITKLNSTIIVPSDPHIFNMFISTEYTSHMETFVDPRIPVIFYIVEKIISDRLDLIIQCDDDCVFDIQEGGRIINGETNSVPSTISAFLSSIIVSAMRGSRFVLDESLFDELIDTDKVVMRPDAYVLYTYQDFINTLTSMSDDPFDAYIHAQSIVDKYNIPMNMSDIRRYLNHSMSSEYNAIKEELDELDVLVDLNNLSDVSPIHQLIIHTVRDGNSTEQD